MSEPSIFFSEVNERQGVFHRRVFLLGGLTGAGLLALSGRLLALQVVETGRYSKLSENNQFNFPLIPPPRGRIVDRNGAVIATNRPNIRLLAARRKDTDLDLVRANIKALLPIDDARLDRVMRDLKASAERQSVTVMEDLEWEQFAGIQVRSSQLPELTAEFSEIRVYPHAGAFAHVVGYVNLPTTEDVEKEREKGDPDPIVRHPGFRIGRTGLERAFDAELRGLSGYRKLEVDARGRVIRADPAGDKAPVLGKEIKLTLDVDIQNRALEVFGEESGAAVMLDCRNGDILCMVSAPSFDANLFVKGVSGADYGALRDYERRPLFDKALMGSFPPGSTFKPGTALALLEAGINPADRVTCTGGYFFGNRTFRCWGRHGSQNMHDAIKNSCDVYFYHMSNRAGIDIIAKTARALGYAQKYDIGLPYADRSVIPDTAWKARRFPNDQKWHPGETLSVAIGQGYVTATPLQMAVAVARIANGRKALLPRLVKSIGGVEQPSGAAVDDLPFPPEYMDIVRAGMASVANDAGGTAYRQSQLGLGDVKMAGKTGTAQVRSYDRVQSRSSASVTWRLKDHNLFTAFAPYDDPRYALAVLVEHGGLGGATAGAPRAREIMRVALLKDREIHDRIVQTPIPEVDPNAPLEGVAPPTPADGPGMPAAPTDAAR